MLAMGALTELTRLLRPMTMVEVTAEVGGDAATAAAAATAATACKGGESTSVYISKVMASNCQFLLHDMQVRELPECHVAPPHQHGSDPNSHQPRGPIALHKFPSICVCGVAFWIRSSIHLASGSTQIASTVPAVFTDMVQDWRSTQHLQLLC